ncbi:MAG: hypothetical protein AAGH90_02125 [Pseudomonadota bacterium]
MSAKRIKRRLLAAALGISALSACGDGATSSQISVSEEVEYAAITTFPISLDRQCRGGEQEMYDECGDQMDLFESAMIKANSQNKTLLVSFGAEWCIWCHVFDKYIKGEAGQFTYTFGEPGDARAQTETLYERRDEATARKEAKELNEFIAENFVLVHIESDYAPGGWDVLDQAGAANYFDNWVPFIFVTDRSGAFVAQLPHGPIEERRDGMFDWYRGYDRPLMLSRLRNMRESAVTADQ